MHIAIYFLVVFPDRMTVNNNKSELKKSIGCLSPLYNVLEGQCSTEAVVKYSVEILPPVISCLSKDSGQWKEFYYSEERPEAWEGGC